MKHHRPERASKLTCPRFWATFLDLFLGADANLAVALWKQLHPSEAQPLLYQLSRVEDSRRHPDSTKRFGDLASPALLMQVCARLAPETGEPRRSDVVLLEKRILDMTTSEGRWV